MVNYSVVARNADVVKVAGVCPVTRKAWELTVPAGGYDRWMSGEMIQLAFPTLDVAARELLVSGITPEGWAQLFGEDDEG